MEQLIIKCNKSNLSKIIHWNSSRYNEYTKQDVIDEIIENFNKKIDCEFTYSCGSYSEKAHNGKFKVNTFGRDYILKIINGDARIINNDHIYLLQ
jgi:hypothetical protein